MNQIEEIVIKSVVDLGHLFNCMHESKEISDDRFEEMNNNLANILKILDESNKQDGEKLTLYNILYPIDFDIQKDEETGKYKIYDMQTLEYKDNCKDDTYLFSTVDEIIERMEIFINDYWFREIDEALLGINVQVGTWEDVVKEAEKHFSELPEEATDCLDVLKAIVNHEEMEIM